MDSEKSIEQYLVKKARDVGGKAWKFVSPGNMGVPDRVVTFPSGQAVFTEVKCETGRLSDPQKNQIKKLKALNQAVRVVYSKKDVDDLAAEFGGKV